MDRSISDAGVRTDAERLLEAAGYACTRAAASLGAGVGSTDFALVQATLLGNGDDPPYEIGGACDRSLVEHTVPVCPHAIASR